MEATANNVDVVLLQETNLSQQAAPAASVMAKMKGWQLLHVPHAGTGKGGVSMLVRERWVATALRQDSTQEASFLSGGPRTVVIASLYRKPTASWQLVHSMAHELRALRGRLTAMLTSLKVLLCCLG